MPVRGGSRKSLPGLDLLTEDEVKERIARFIMGRKHWVFIPGYTGGAAIVEIEEKFYNGTANADFDVMMGVMGQRFMWIAFGHKRHLPPARLAKFILAHHDEHCKVPEHQRLTKETLEKHDVLFLCNAEEADVICVQFFKWIEDTVNRLEDEDAIKKGKISEPND